MVSFHHDASHPYLPFRYVLDIIVYVFTLPMGWISPSEGYVTSIIPTINIALWVFSPTTLQNNKNICLRMSLCSHRVYQSGSAQSVGARGGVTKSNHPTNSSLHEIINGVHMRNLKNLAHKRSNIISSIPKMETICRPPSTHIKTSVC